jgi:hypothetical protein
LFFLFSTPFKSTALVGKSREDMKTKDVCRGKRRRKLVEYGREREKDKEREIGQAK